MTEHVPDTRLVDATARLRRRRLRLMAAGLLLLLGLGAAGWSFFFPPLTSEERPLVGRWEVPLYAERGYGTYEWEFKSNHTVHRRIVNPSGQVAMDDVIGWNVSDGKLTLVHRHSDWVSRLKSGNTTLTETGDAELVWDGRDRFSFAPIDPSGKALKAMVLVRKSETGSKQPAQSP